MKKIKFLLPFFILAILISYTLSQAHFFIGEKDYVSTNEMHIKLAAKIYKRYNKKSGLEYILFFNDNSLGDGNVIVINLSNKTIGIPDGGSADFYSCTDKLLVQWGDEAYSTISYTNMPFDNENLISSYSVTDSLIIFNTFNKLKSFGKEIIIKKM